MGGGGAIRAASKIAGINAGLRGVSSADHPIATAARRAATRPVGPIVSAPEEVNWSGLSASQSNNPIDAAVAQRPSWELDDWEFAGGEGDAVVSSEPLPRLVFGGAPTLEEAKEATNELKDALNKIYLSSPNTTGSKEVDHDPTLYLIPKQEIAETKACVVSEATKKSLPANALKAFKLLNESSAAQLFHATKKSLPANALKAFKLLNESSAAQSVVASIASDPNVWSAVLQNEALSEFIQSQKSIVHFSETHPVTDEFVSDTIPAHQFSKAYDSEKSSAPGYGFMNFLEDLKGTVFNMMNGLSDYFQNIFGGPSSKASEGTDAASGGANYIEKSIGASFVGLAVMVIMVVILKRP